MSFAALAWASKQNVGKASDKLVLLAYADRHNEETSCAYPSLAWLCEFSSLNRKTVIEAVARLEKMGALSDTGKRMGATSQIKVYRLHLETVPKTEQSQKRNSPVISVKQSRKRDTEPVREPIPSEAKASSGKRATLFPDAFVPIISGKTLETVSAWPPDRLADELEHFADHHRAKGTRSYDWQASWRTWVKNSKKWEPRNGRMGRNGSANGISATVAAAIDVFGYPDASDERRVPRGVDEMPRLGGPGGHG